MVLVFLPVMLMGRSELLFDFEIQFYTEKISFSCPDEWRRGVVKEAIEEEVFINYKKLQSTDYNQFIDRLSTLKSSYKLNDWFYFELLQVIADKIVVDASDASYKEVLIWYWLNESGYETRLTYLGESVFINVKIEEDIFDLSTINIGDKSFANISAFYHKSSRDKAVFLLDFNPAKSGKVFEFSILDWPALKPSVLKKKLDFKFENKSHSLVVQVDANVGRMMTGYPPVREQLYIKAPLSETLRGSLLPQLKKLTKGLTKADKVRFVITLSRAAFAYREDRQAYGRNRPMVAEEVLLNKWSDCEDRVALAYNLIQELIGLSMIVPVYHDHLSLAVHLEGVSGDLIHHNGLDYVFCDPTGPVNSSKIGSVPKEYEGQALKILDIHN